MATLVCPSAYVEGYEQKARLHDQELADLYIRHTTIGDPVLDPIMEEISSLPAHELHAFVKAGIEQHDRVLRDAPQPLRDFFENFQEPPWLDPNAFMPGIRAFHANTSDTVAAFLCGVLVEGFTTLIRKSFVMTGRVLHEPTQRRQKQNIRQLVEILLPGGLERTGDGWKLSMRIRFVHARVRHLLLNSDKWDVETYGMPLSAAHLGYAIAVFSVGLMEYSTRMGAAYNEEESRSVIDVWRYAGHVMGIPASILYANEEEARAIRRIGCMCEPPCDDDSVIMANAWLGSAAMTAGITDPKEQRAITKLVYRLSRSLIGDKLSDQLQFPKNILPGPTTLFLYRLKERIKRSLKNKQLIKSEDFSQLIQASAYDEAGLSYKMPDHVEQNASSEW